MLTGEGNDGERWKTTTGLISKKATLHVQHTFLVHFFALVGAGISHFVTAATKFECCSSNKKMSLFFISRWASLACRLVSLFLCLSPALYCSIYCSVTSKRRNTLIPLFLLKLLNIWVTYYPVHLKLKLQKYKTATITTTIPQQFSLEIN